jgi:hypothetical protein
MCETLPKGTITTVSAERDRTKNHLYPSKHRVRFSDDSMRAHGPRTQRQLVDVQLEVHAQRKLRRDRHEKDFGKLGMRARKKLSATVRMPEYVATQRERKPCGLQ